MLPALASVWGRGSNAVLPGLGQVRMDLLVVLDGLRYVAWGIFISYEEIVVLYVRPRRVLVLR